MMVDIFPSPHLLHLRPSSPGASSLVSFSPSLTSPVIHTVCLLLSCHFHSSIFSEAAPQPTPVFFVLFFLSFLLFPCLTPPAPFLLRQMSVASSPLLPFCFIGTRCSLQWSRLQPVGTHNSWNGSKRHAGGALMYFGCSGMCNWACTLHSLCLSRNHCFDCGPLSWSVVRESARGKLAQNRKMNVMYTIDINNDIIMHIYGECRWIFYPCIHPFSTLFPSGLRRTVFNYNLNFTW